MHKPFYWFSIRIMTWYVGFKVTMQRSLLETGPLSLGIYDSINSLFLPGEIASILFATGLPL
jgi:hypothetical protein